MGIIDAFGRYAMLMMRTFRKPSNMKVFRGRVVDEMISIGIDSLPLIFIISTFMGAVISIQLAANIDSPLIPKYTVGYASRQSIIYEFSTTVLSLILAGKVGSNIASELGSMKISEQVDALEIMGINSASFLILPKIVGFLIINPFLVALSMVLSITGSYLSVTLTGMVPHDDFIYGIQFDFSDYDLLYAFVKTMAFAFIISSVSSYQGYTTTGGALDVGRSSTGAVVFSIFTLLTANLVITALMLL